MCSYVGRVVESLLHHQRLKGFNNGMEAFFLHGMRWSVFIKLERDLLCYFPTLFMLVATKRFHRCSEICAKLLGLSYIHILAQRTGAQPFPAIIYCRFYTLQCDFANIYLTGVPGGRAFSYETEMEALLNGCVQLEQAVSQEVSKPNINGWRILPPLGPKHIICFSVFWGLAKEEDEKRRKSGWWHLLSGKNRVTERTGHTCQPLCSQTLIFNVPSSPDEHH